MIKVVQCWDDGVEDDIRLCDMLRQHKARATFNLNPGRHPETREAKGWRYDNRKDVFLLTRSQLRSTYEGFTIANHSMTHPHATKIPLEQWRGEVVDARKALQDFFGQPIHGFVYPYGDSNAATEQVVREAGHIYARATGNATPCYPPADAMVFKPDCHFRNAAFHDLYAKAKASGCGVFYFWGHSYEMVNEEDWQALEAKIKFINADKDAVWVDVQDLFM